ncbi:16572_t:CDS:2, partial [Racocetra fulgida]
PGVRECHCFVPYNDSVYLFGGHIKWFTWAVNSFFHAAKMPFVTSSIPWVALNTTNAANTCDMTCVVEPSMVYQGFQVYNFKSNVWNEAQYLVGYPKDINMGLFQPRSILIQPGIVLIWGGKHSYFTLRVIYKLDMTVTPWKWENISYNERVFIFGGIERFKYDPTLGEGVPMNLSYIYNITESQILIPDYQLPYAFTHSVVGVVDDSMFIIVLSYNDFLEDRQMSIIPLNIARLKFETPFEASSNLTKARLRGAGVQPLGSD